MSKLPAVLAHLPFPVIASPLFGVEQGRDMSIVIASTTGI